MVPDPLELELLAVVSHLQGTEPRSSERPSNTFEPLHLLSCPLLEFIALFYAFFKWLYVV